MVEIDVGCCSLKSAIFRCISEGEGVYRKHVRVDRGVYCKILELASEYKVMQDIIPSAAIKRVMICNDEVIRKIIDSGFIGRMAPRFYGDSSISFVISSKDYYSVDLMSSCLGLRKDDTYRWLIYVGLSDYIDIDEYMIVDVIKHLIDKILTSK